MIFQGQARSRLPFWGPVVPDDLARSRLSTSRRAELQRYLVYLEAPPAASRPRRHNECQDVTAVEAKRCLLVTEPDQGPRGQM